MVEASKLDYTRERIKKKKWQKTRLFQLCNDEGYTTDDASDFNSSLRNALLQGWNEKNTFKEKTIPIKIAPSKTNPCCEQDLAVPSLPSHQAYSTHSSVHTPGLVETDPR